MHRLNPFIIVIMIAVAIVQWFEKLGKKREAKKAKKEEKAEKDGRAHSDRQMFGDPK